MKDPARPLISVYRDADGKSTCWRWSCHVTNCGGHDWRGRHRDALADANGHLLTHVRFGFHAKGA